MAHDKRPRSPKEDNDFQAKGKVLTLLNLKRLAKFLSPCRRDDELGDARVYAPIGFSRIVIERKSMSPTKLQRLSLSLQPSQFAHKIAQLRNSLHLEASL